jgi:hypothetical protein
MYQGFSKGDGAVIGDISCENEALNFDDVCETTGLLLPFYYL